MSVYPSPYPDVELCEQSITECAFAGLESRPDETVLTDGSSGCSLSTAEFISQVKCLAGGLSAQGLGHGNVVALMAPNIPDYCVIFHANAWAGGTTTTQFTRRETKRRSVSNC